MDLKKSIATVMKGVRKLLSSFFRLVHLIVDWLRHPVPNYDGGGLYPQSIFVVGCWAFWTLWPPFSGRSIETGFAISALGLAAVIMTVRADHLTKWERVVWVIIGFALFIGEVHVIDQDHVQQDKEHRAEMHKQETEFEAVLKQSQKEFDATMRRTDQAIDATLGGTDSFCFIEPLMDHSIGAGKAGVFHDSFVSMKRGRSPLRNIHLTVITTWHFPDGTPVSSSTEPYSFGDAALEAVMKFMRVV